MLTPGDLRSPTGDLGDSLFPGESPSKLEERLQGYLTEGYAKAAALAYTGEDADDVARAWAYYRAYHAVYVRMLNEPSTVQIEGQGQKSSLWPQIEAMGKLADAAKATYEDLLPEVTSTTVSGIPETTSVPTQFTY
jgi:hypothetical protein